MLIAPRLETIKEELGDTLMPGLPHLVSPPGAKTSEAGLSIWLKLKTFTKVP